MSKDGSVGLGVLLTARECRPADAGALGGHDTVCSCLPLQRGRFNDAPEQNVKGRRPKCRPALLALADAAAKQELQAEAGVVFHQALQRIDVAAKSLLAQQ